MGFGIFIHRSDSIYDDSPAEQYQFPRQYLSRVSGLYRDWIVYYEPRKVAATRGYFALAKVARVIADPKATGMYVAVIELGTYLDFINLVAFRETSDNSPQSA